LVDFLVIWYVLQPFGIFYVHLVHFLVIWYLFWLFGIFHPFWYIVAKNLATLVQGTRVLREFQRRKQQRQRWQEQRSHGDGRAAGKKSSRSRTRPPTQSSGEENSARCDQKFCEKTDQFCQKWSLKILSTEEISDQNMVIKIKK
jgi:hypothetical protein